MNLLSSSLFRLRVRIEPPIDKRNSTSADDPIHALYALKTFNSIGYCMKDAVSLRLSSMNQKKNLT